MKRFPLLFGLLLAVAAVGAGQTQTRERRSSEREPASQSQSAAVRDRVVGASKAANHFDKQKANADQQNQTPLVAASNARPQSVNQGNQDAGQPKWGNTAVVIRSAQNEQVSAAKGSTNSNATLADRDSGSGKKVVQQTVMITEAPPALAPIRGNSNSRSPSSTRSVAPVSVYRVGIGDVLDIRLSNLPTRESTLFTVLKDGVLEYPLLNAPISVTGLTVDEIAKLLGDQIKVIQAARVSVSVRDYASHTVVITGLVDNPGRKILRRETMPLYVVLAEALPRSEASIATITRAGKEETVSLKNEQATLVLPGDAIKISGGAATVKQFVYVGGDVASPGEREFRDGMTLTQALLSAGGTSRTGKPVVKVARRNPSGFLSSSEFNLRSIEDGKSQDPVLEAGDRIEVTRGM